ncbi:PAS domain S-box protein [Methylococcus sp. EFPC2]|uniref:PAS domain S-box protein n=1 Tax=Methylococcus sp. EFPC2 TaxID=2812648 RepID=UPI001967C39B|nr:PAS domain S-box protein [Methylococcus sp. EFPC2]QSA98790.1 PAS domain S-box protein [Methylococcus sp. EFPC2]
MSKHPKAGVNLSGAAREKREELFYLFSRAIQQSPHALIIARADGIIEYVNPSFTQLSGYQADEVVGGYTHWFGPDSSLTGRYRGLWSTLREGRVWRGEILDHKKDGQAYWARESITPISDPDGTITHYLVIRQDITQEKNSRQALAESESRFRQVAEMSGEWLWEQDADGRYTYCSAAVTAILGYRPEELIGHSYLEFTRTEDLAQREREMVEPIQSHQAFHHLVNRYRHHDGHVVYTESTGSPVFDDAGRLVKWLGVDHDITRRKAYEDALKLRDRAIEAASVGIVIGDARKPGAPNLYVNPAVSRITGYSSEELINHNMSLLQGRDTGEKELAQIHEALTQGESCQLVIKNYRRNGEPFWNELQISPVRDENGEVTHFIGILDDVTVRRQAEAERRELEIARQIQTSLLPKAPLRYLDLWVAGTCATANHVGGDYFDYYPAGEALDVVIADVSGHSMGAALIMAEARSCLRAETRHRNTSGRGPGSVLCDLNSLLFDDLNGSDLFISLFILRFLPVTRELRYANAGHPPALLLRAGTAECESLDAEGLILGVDRQIQFEEKSVTLRPGDRLLMYTDGITDARNRQGEFFGLEQLSELFVSFRDDNPQAVVDKLLAELCAYCGEIPCEDDVTLVVLTVT